MTPTQIANINPSNVILDRYIGGGDAKRTAVQCVYAASDTSYGNEIGYVYRSLVNSKWVAVLTNSGKKKPQAPVATKAEAVAKFESVATRMGLILLDDKTLVTLYNLLRTPALGAAGNPQTPIVRKLLVERGFDALLLIAETTNSRIILA